MARRANPALIGGFVVGAVVLAVVGLVVFGGGRFFRLTKPAVAYFEGSVKGVAIGAPVTFQGVKIGAVTDVRVVIDPKDLKITTPIFFEIDASRLTDPTGAALKMQKDSAGMNELIGRGLRAELELQSFVTGQVGIGLAFRPGTPVRLTGLSPDSLELPTVASGMEKLTRTLETLPVEEIATAAKETLDGIRALVQAPETRATLRSLQAAVERSDETLLAIQKLAQHVDSQLDPLMTQIDATAKAARGTLLEAQSSLARLTPRVDGALQDYQTLARNLDERLGRLSASLDRTLASVDRTLGGADDVLADGSEVRVNLATALEELGDAAQSIRALADYLQRNPSSVVFGKGKAPK
jgi:paraquat-inducible protein B